MDSAGRVNGRVAFKWKSHWLSLTKALLFVPQKCEWHSDVLLGLSETPKMPIATNRSFCMFSFISFYQLKIFEIAATFDQPYRLIFV